MPLCGRGSNRADRSKLLHICDLDALVVSSHLADEPVLAAPARPLESRDRPDQVSDTDKGFLVPG